jgi:phosphoglycerate dehydrogenase-like enzyme
MKRTARLVNTARGPIVDQTALVNALQARTIAEAAIDVFDSEPLPNGHPFRTLRTSVTEELYRTFYGDAAAKIAAWLETAAA